MSTLIELHEIDEFSLVKSIPDSAINDEIISNIKNLDEKRELEPFIRQILYDPNETPHGPTEIADILTTHLHIRGEKRLAAFVLKGKSFKTVTSRNFAHQFLKFRQIPGLGLMVFGAVGKIQDDAQRDFVQIAFDSKRDYLIIDSQNLARLLIAYDKICPKDGTPYNDEGICNNGHELDKGITLEMRVREKASYTIIELKDKSNAGAKRYTAKVLLDKHYPKDVIRTVIHDVTEEIKSSNYYRNEIAKLRWKETKAHVVWLYIAFDLNDIQRSNWICRTCWIDSSLSVDMRPLGLNGNEILDDIEIEWNDDYHSLKAFYEKSTAKKEDVLNSDQRILTEMTEFAEEAIKLFDKYKCGVIPENEFVVMMQKMESLVTDIYNQSTDIPKATIDSEDYDQACHNIFATIHDMFLYYNKKGLETWPKQNRDFLMEDTIKRYKDDLERINFEKSKIR